MRSTAALCWLAAFLSSCGGALAAQDLEDERDTVVLKDGRTLRGRVIARHDKEELLLQQDQGRLRLAKARVQSVSTVRDRLAELFERLDKHRDNPKFVWLLCEWARMQGLHGMARLLALDLVLNDDGHDEAHRLLGHRKRGKEWLWPRPDSRKAVDHRREEHDKYTVYWTRKRYEGHISGKLNPLVLRSESFELWTDAGTRRAVDTLLDLERLYLFWMERFGVPLKLWEVVRPIQIRVSKSMETFPVLYSANKIPVFLVEDSEKRGFTYYRAGDKHPHRLFTVAGQGLIMATLIDQQSVVKSHRTRICPWAEMGVAQWLEDCFAGPPGRMRRVPPKLDKEAAQLVLKVRPQLKLTTHLRYTFFFRKSDKVPEHWAQVRALVHFLLREQQQTKVREAFERYFYEALHTGKGDSSSLLDRCLGVRVEELEKRFYPWLESVAKTP